MRRVCVVVLIAACGRIGFDSLGDGMHRDANRLDGSGALAGDGGLFDAPAMTIACADQNLGSAVGPDVASGSTSGRPNQYTGCSGDGSDIAYGWFAPASGMFRIDLCASAPGYDTALAVLQDSCTGPQLACNDDGPGNCGGAPDLASALTINATAGSGYVIVIDGQAPGGGNYQLAITQM